MKEIYITDYEEAINLWLKGYIVEFNNYYGQWEDISCATLEHIRDDYDSFRYYI